MAVETPGLPSASLVPHGKTTFCFRGTTHLVSHRRLEIIKAAFAKHKDTAQRQLQGILAKGIQNARPMIAQKTVQMHES